MLTTEQLAPGLLILILATEDLRMCIWQLPPLPGVIQGWMPLSVAGSDCQSSLESCSAQLFSAPCSLGLNCQLPQ